MTTIEKLCFFGAIAILCAMQFVDSYIFASLNDRVARLEMPQKSPYTLPDNAQYETGHNNGRWAWHVTVVDTLFVDIADSDTLIRDEYIMPPTQMILPPYGVRRKP